MPPTILITYSNDASGSLQVAAESKDVQRLLDRVPNKNYQIKLLPEIATADLADELMHFEQDLEIFHYCGHAHPQGLVFTDKDAGAEKLAKRLGFCKNLKIVFLNGCETRAQARLFHEAGVPYILVTSVRIKDAEAWWFASQFYKYLILGNDAAGAFEKAKADAALEDRGLDSARGLTAFIDEEEEDFDWELKVKEGSEAYRLPLKKYEWQALPKVEHGDFLKNLLLSLRDYDSPLDNKYRDTIAEIEWGAPKPETMYRDMLQILPYPVGIRLRQIYASDLSKSESEEQYYRELLHDYACFFETLLHYSFAMLVSQLWQYQKDIPQRETSEDFDLIRQLICSNRLTGDLKDYGPAIQAAYRILGKAGIPNPIPRVSDAFGYLNGQAFPDACRFFDLQKDFFRSKIRLTAETAIQLCYQSQRHLEEAFRHFAFCIEKVLVSVRHIDVINFRYVEEAYANEVWQLVASQDGAIRQKRFRRPMENKSVLCFLEDKQDPDSPSINLFPFFLDRNAFAKSAGNVVDLYQFAGYFHDEWVAGRSANPVDHACYYFMSLNNPDRIWRFDERKSHEATISHIDEPVDDARRHAQMLTAHGDLNKFFGKFAEFLHPQTTAP